MTTSLPIDSAHAFDHAAAEAWLARTAESLKVYVDPGHASYYDLYLGRADALAALGRPPREVQRELALAGGCWTSNAETWLARWPVHRLRKRRLEPLELAIVAGDQAFFEVARAHVAFPVLETLAGAGPAGVAEELAALGAASLLDPPASESDRPGLLGALVWGLLSALVHGDGTAFAALREPARDRERELAPGTAGGVGRLAATVRALDALLPPRPEEFVRALSDEARLHAETRSPPAGAVLPNASPAPGAVDLTALALLAGAASTGLEIAPLAELLSADPLLAPLVPWLEVLG